MKALVTGGTGFLGQRLAIRLQQAGWDVTAMGRQAAIGNKLETAGIHFLQVDLRDKEGIAAACAGQNAVFHCGGLSAPWGAYRSFYESNVIGTEHVIAGCIRHQVERLVHVSSPSVYFRTAHRLNVHESAQLPSRQASSYAATKRLAEIAVQRACAEGLQGVMIRPRAIFGPGDTSLVPRLIQANATRGIPLISGGSALIDLTYVENVVDALLLCQSAPAYIVGRMYNISNDEPMSFAEAVSRLFGKLGIPVHAKRLPFAAAYGAAAAMELAAKVLPGDREPLLTRAMTGMLGRSQTLDIRAAREELGYTPQVSVEAGMDAYAQWWKMERKAQ
ncbi:NAD-dependent epimerase/dehydratase family protein [Paenibacillus eucommiae]|uniref:Nucleoside-diphosphate-sugar epimerase n=1 Tax=Paenibacillus eucommiae TaxID=1355755 RepID=A0ABS4J1U3_9BACL|nr:NAD-dependent epimerase/dehydratase family protein [Paenibacillus eucommiae]MBP1993226.1 nucleoside-diphosphate-sugar epimerase [Paenibacillus eucommiae]